MTGSGNGAMEDFDGKVYKLPGLINIGNFFFISEGILNFSKMVCAS